MQSISKILVVVDPNQGYEQPAVQRAVKIAGAMGAEVKLFACLREKHFLPNKFYSRKDSDLVKNSEHARYQHVLADIGRQLGGRELTCSWATSMDEPLLEGVLKQVSLNEPQLVIKETGFHHKISRAIYSHTDWDLIRQCPTPLWLCKEGDWSDDASIIACIDPIHPDDQDSTIDRKIMELARVFGTAMAANVEIFHAAVPLSEYAKPFVIDAIVQKAKDEYALDLGKFLEEYQVPSRHIHVVDGFPETCLEDIVKKLNGGVVVLGAFARHGVSKMLLGSTAERVLDRVSCDVLVVKPHGYTDG